MRAASGLVVAVAVDAVVDVAFDVAVAVEVPVARQPGQHIQQSS